jgi:hypothetical protein
MVYQNRQVVLSNSCRFLATHGKEMLATHLRKLNCLVRPIEGFAKLTHARHISKRQQGSKPPDSPVRLTLAEGLSGLTARGSDIPSGRSDRRGESGLWRRPSRQRRIREIPGRRRQ